MLIIEKDKHAKGLLIKGDFWDFDRLYFAISKFTGDFGLHHSCCFPGYGSAAENLLGLNYDLRHAWRGDRQLVEVYNGISDEWFSNIYFDNNDAAELEDPVAFEADPEDDDVDLSRLQFAKFDRADFPDISERNAYFCVDMNFPEAVFYALIVTKLLDMKQLFYDAVEAAVMNNDRFKVYTKDYQLFGAEEDVLRVSLFAKQVLHALYLFVGEENYNAVMRAFKKNDGFFSRYDSEYTSDVMYEYYVKSNEDDNPKDLTRTLISLFDFDQANC